MVGRHTRMPGFAATAALEPTLGSYHASGRTTGQAGVTAAGCCTCLDTNGNPISRFDIGGWCPWAAAKCYFQCPFGRGTHTCRGCNG